jgi:hypothetical protein
MASSASNNDAPAQPYLTTMPSESFNWQITLSEKVIAITGANRGIGLGIAEVCLSNAAKTVFSLDITEPGDEFKTLADKFPGRFEYIQTNVTDEESVEKSINAIVEKAGRIDGLVANAGMTKHQPALQFQRPELQKLFELNVFGAYFCANIVARKFIELGIKGSIVMTSSMTSYRPNRVSHPQPSPSIQTSYTDMNTGRSLCPLRRHKSCRPQPLPHPRHGMEQTRHSRQQHLARFRPHRHDILRRDCSRLGP